MNIVVLCASASWQLDICEQARDLDLASIRLVRSPEDAMAMMSERSPSVSHFLIEPFAAGDGLDRLMEAALSHGGELSIVVLDEPCSLAEYPDAPSIIFVRLPSKNWLRRVLHQDVLHPQQDGPSLDELAQALVQSRIQTRYQPIVRLSDGHPVGLEVLARMDLPKHGFLLPDRFVPQIEEAGLAWPLTQAVITRAFTDWGDGRLGSFGLSLAFNFSLDVLLIPETLTWLETRRRQAGLPAERIVIELTESRPVSQLHRLRHAISTLRGIGYGLAIDDVGPQLRDHHSLLDLQFTTLKLDKDLVMKSAASRDVHDFLTEAIASARSANLTIVAEGVESAPVWQQMKDLGVDQAQGFLIARPLLATAVPVWYHDWVSRRRQPPVTL